MPTLREKHWAEAASRFLKEALKQRSVSYKELAQRLQAHGLDENERSIAAKLARASLPLSFFLATMSVLEIKGFSLSDLEIDQRGLPVPTLRKSGASSG